MENYSEWEQQEKLKRDSKGGIIILPHVSFEEHVAVQRETKARTLLLQSLPEDHMVDFHHLDDAREIWLAVNARSQKILSQLNQIQAKPDNDDVNIKFLRALPPFWSQVALTLKTRGGLEYLSFDDLYNKLRSLEIDVKGRSSYGSRSTAVAPTHSAFIGTASINTKMVYSDQQSYSSLISYNPVPAGSIMEDLGHFARECNVKKVDEKAKYSAFKISEEHIGSDEVYDLSTPSVFGPEPDNREVKSLYERFVKAGNMHEVPPPITGTFMPTSYQSDLAET
nr:xylulose kinase-1 [Tanacetum cinerariifolium]